MNILRHTSDNEIEMFEVKSLKEKRTTHIWTPFGRK